MWPCIVTDFFVIKPTRCTNFTNLFCHETTCFGQFVCPSSGVYSLYTKQWYIPYRFVDSFRAGPGWNWVPSWSCSKAVYKWYARLVLVFFFTLMWPCIVTNFFVIKPTRCTNFTKLFCHEQDQDGTQFHPGPARKLSTNLYDIYHCWMYSE